jgi:hypothetical protein
MASRRNALAGTDKRAANIEGWFRRKDRIPGDASICASDAEITIVCTENSNPDVMTVKPAEDRV